MSDSLSELVESNGLLLDATMSRLSDYGVRAVALGYVENSGIVRTKAIPLSKLSSAVERGVGMSPVFDAFLVDDSITSSPVSGGPIGDLRLFPDLAMAALLPEEGWCWMPVRRFTQDLVPHRLDHRNFAVAMVDRLREVGLTSKMSFEVEWILSSDLEGEFQPATVGPAYSLERVGELGDYLAELLVALERADIEVEQIHPEYAPGQFEVSVAPRDPIAAADQCILVKHIIRSVSRNFGMRASFAPSVVAGGVGNGGHLHFSFFDNGVPLFGAGEPSNYGLTQRGESILAGVLAELDALSAIGSPSVISYLRLVPQHWAGAYRCWGVENREAALRLVKTGPLVAPSGANAEVKSFDLSASPHLVVGALLAVAMASLGSDGRLPPPMGMDPALMSALELQQFGVDRLPTELDQALGALSSSRILREAMGEDLYTAFVAVRRAEIAAFAALSPTKMVEVLRWKY